MINNAHFQKLQEKFGSHTEAARQLGIWPSHYRYIRRTGKMSETLAKLIKLLAEDKEVES